MDKVNRDMKGGLDFYHLSVTVNPVSEFHFSIVRAACVCKHGLHTPVNNCFCPSYLSSILSCLSFSPILFLLFTSSIHLW